MPISEKLFEKYFLNVKINYTFAFSDSNNLCSANHKYYNQDKAGAHSLHNGSYVAVSPCPGLVFCIHFKNSEK